MSGHSHERESLGTRRSDIRLAAQLLGRHREAVADVLVGVIAEAAVVGQVSTNRDTIAQNQAQISLSWTTMDEDGRRLGAGGRTRTADPALMRRML